MLSVSLCFISSVCAGKSRKPSSTHIAQWNYIHWRAGVLTSWTCNGSQRRTVKVVLCRCNPEDIRSTAISSLTGSTLVSLHTAFPHHRLGSSRRASRKWRHRLWRTSHVRHMLALTGTHLATPVSLRHRAWSSSSATAPGLGNDSLSNLMALAPSCVIRLTRSTLPTKWLQYLPAPGCFGSLQRRSTLHHGPDSCGNVTGNWWEGHFTATEQPLGMDRLCRC